MTEQKTNEIAGRVKQAFEAARQGDFGPSSGLRKLGQAVVPHLAPYLKDGDEAIRRQAVTLLKLAGGKEGLPLLAQALGDAADDIRKRAALALYENFDPAAGAPEAAVGEALRRAVKNGLDSAAALLLLSYYPGRETEEALRAAAGRAAQTELYDWSPVVGVALPAGVALSRLGDQQARARLLETIEAASLDELRFLLQVLREVDAPEVLHLIKRKTLGDTREVPGGVPSGAEPQRRLCDEAVNALVRRLNLQVSFKLDDARRYTDAQINEVRDKINASLPR